MHSMTVTADKNDSVPQILSPVTKRWNLIGISLGVFAMGIEYYVASLALPSIIVEFGSDYVTTQWIVIIYSLVLVVSVLGISSLGDLYDKKKLYLFGVLLFTLGSFLCGFADSIQALIVFRGFQALGAAFLVGLRVSIISVIFPTIEWGYAQGIITGAATLGVALGPGLGGLVLSLGNWRWLFWLNVPVGIIVLMILSLSMPQLPPLKSMGSFDVGGSAIFAICILCLMGSLISLETGGTHYRLMLLLLATLLLFIYFLCWESRQDNPILDFSLFQSLDLSLNFLVFLVTYSIFGSAQLIFPIFLELIRNYSPQIVGVTLSSLAILSILIAPIAGIFSDLLGARRINLIGLCLILVGAILASTLQPDTTIFGFLVRVVCLELGIIIFVPPTVTLMMAAMPPERSGTVSGLIALSRSLGLSFGSSLFGLLMPILINIKKDGINRHILDHNFPFDLTTFPKDELSTGIDQMFRLSILIACFSIATTTYLWIKGPSNDNPEADVEVDVEI